MIVNECASLPKFINICQTSFKQLKVCCYQCIGYRQFGGHKNRENESLKIEFNFLVLGMSTVISVEVKRFRPEKHRIFITSSKQMKKEK